MALIKIESARVVRHVGIKGGFACEEYKTLPDGRSWPVTYTVWHEGAAPQIDGIVQVTGELNVNQSKPNEFGKTFANINVNNCTVQAIGVDRLPDVPVIQDIINSPAQVIVNGGPVDVAVNAPF